METVDVKFRCYSGRFSSSLGNFADERMPKRLFLISWRLSAHVHSHYAHNIPFNVRWKLIFAISARVCRPGALTIRTAEGKKVRVIYPPSQTALSHIGEYIIMCFRSPPWCACKTCIIRTLFCSATGGEDAGCILFVSLCAHGICNYDLSQQ